jgi:hypothetical protein
MGLQTSSSYLENPCGCTDTYASNPNLVILLSLSLCIKKRSLIFPRTFFHLRVFTVTNTARWKQDPCDQQKKGKKKDQSSSVDVSVLLLLCGSYLSLFIVCWIQLDHPLYLKKLDCVLAGLSKLRSWPDTLATLNIYQNIALKFFLLPIKTLLFNSSCSLQMDCPKYKYAAMIGEAREDRITFTSVIRRTQTRHKVAKKGAKHRANNTPKAACELLRCDSLVTGDDS